MSLTELRDTFSSVSDAVTVPRPDVAGFERRVAGVRRRRTATRVAGAVAAVAVVASGSTLALSQGDNAADDRTGTAHEPAAPRPHWVPVVVEGHLHIVDQNGAMGGEGPAVESIVGSTPEGVVVITEDGTLSRLDEQTSQLQQLVPGTVRTAYLDGDAVVYQNANGMIRWWGIEPSVASSDSAQTDQGRLMAATTNRVVIANGPGGALVSWDADGPHELVLDRLITTIHRIETAGDVIAIQTEDGVYFLSPDGLRTNGYVGDRLGALAPDGHSFARQADSRQAVELLDPDTLRVTPVEGPAGTIADLGWAPDGDLLAVVENDGTHTLWRCSPAGTGCAPQVGDPTGTLRLG